MKDPKIYTDKHLTLTIRKTYLNYILAVLLIKIFSLLAFAFATNLQ